MRRSVLTVLLALLTLPLVGLMASGAAAHRSAAARTQAHAASGVPTHIPTWTFDDNCTGGLGASKSLVRRWVTYAVSGCGPRDHKAIHDCHGNGVAYCTDFVYLDAILVYHNNPPVDRSAHESWWLHQPGHTDRAHRLVFNTPGVGIGNMLNQSNRGVDAWFKSYVHKYDNDFDGLQLDDTAGSPSDQFYGSGFTKSNEISTVRGILAEHRDMAESLIHKNGQPFLQVDNGLSVNPFLKPAFPELNHPGSVVGLVAEDDPLNASGTLVSYYSTLLDDMAYMDHMPRNNFLVLLSYDPNGSLKARRVQAATELLGFNGGQIVSWSSLDQRSRDLQIWPEEGIYPTGPVESMGRPGGRGCLAGSGKVCSRGGHRSLEVAGGVYRREFRQCYNRGVAFGSCAVIMNDTGHKVTVKARWLHLSYDHKIAMIGHEVQAGGRINVNGAAFTAGKTTVGPRDALLIAQ
jgi:hypothetical protein